jgi:hypothetical protein
MSECNTSSNQFNRAPIIGSTSQITWSGADIDCLGICSGDRLTTLQNAIATKLCELSESADVSEIIVPDCLKAAWGTQDETILNFIVFILDQLCSQASTIEDLNTAIENSNPIVTIDLGCCSDNPCVKTGTIKLSEALDSIITCLCDTKTELATLQEYVGNVDTITNLSQFVNTLNSTVNSIQSTVNTLQSDITCIKNNCCTDCIN